MEKNHYNYFSEINRTQTQPRISKINIIITKSEKPKNQHIPKLKKRIFVTESRPNYHKQNPISVITEKFKQLSEKYENPYENMLSKIEGTQQGIKSQIAEISQLKSLISAHTKSMVSQKMISEKKKIGMKRGLRTAGLEKHKKVFMKGMNAAIIVPIKKQIFKNDINFC